MAANILEMDLPFSVEKNYVISCSSDSIHLYDAYIIFWVYARQKSSFKIFNGALHGAARVVTSAQR